jgi:hypothetical protein
MYFDFKELLKAIEREGQVVIATEEEREASRGYNKKLSEFIHPPFGVIK